MTKIRFRILMLSLIMLACISAECSSIPASNNTPSDDGIKMISEYKSKCESLAKRVKSDYTKNTEQYNKAYTRYINAKAGFDGWIGELKYNVTQGADITSSDKYNMVAEGRAKDIIAACEQFKAKSGHYPEKLSELVPDFLPVIPAAKYSLMMGTSFRYFARQDNHALMYEVVSPYDRKYYVFEKKAWEWVD